MYRHGLELRSKITSDGLLELFLQKTPVPEPAADEIVIWIGGTAQSVGHHPASRPGRSLRSPGRWDSRKTQGGGAPSEGAHRGTASAARCGAAGRQRGR